MQTHNGLLAEIIFKSYSSIFSATVNILSYRSLKEIIFYFNWTWNRKAIHSTNKLKKRTIINEWHSPSFSIVNPTPHCSAPILMRRSYGQDSGLGSERVASVITECNIYVWPAGLQGFDWPPGQPMNRGEREERRGINTSNEEAAVRG